VVPFPLPEGKAEGGPDLAPIHPTSTVVQSDPPAAAEATSNTGTGW
jgi:hypothetical protein